MAVLKRTLKPSSINSVSVFISRVDKTFHVIGLRRKVAWHVTFAVSLRAKRGNPVGVTRGLEGSWELRKQRRDWKAALRSQ